MRGEAVGTFEVTLEPVEPASDPIGALFIRKTFRGDLQGGSTGRMLSCRGGVAGSAGYVAMECVTATLAGREGTFTLQHNGLMDRGTPSLDVVVVPDSGTQGLLGISGSMRIDQTDGRHNYRFSYAIPD